MSIVIKVSVTVGNTFLLQKVSQTTEPRAKIVVHKAVLKTWSRCLSIETFKCPFLLIIYSHHLLQRSREFLCGGIISKNCTESKLQFRPLAGRWR